MKPPGDRRAIPQPGGESFQGEEGGPLTYSISIPPAKNRGRLIPAGHNQQQSQQHQVKEGPPLTAFKLQARKTRALLPSQAEMSLLPQNARKAYMIRCALRVAKLADVPQTGGMDPMAAVKLIVEASTIQTPLTQIVRCMRRDFDLLLRQSRTKHWTDDTPVAPEIFGPLWPAGLIPSLIEKTMDSSEKKV